MNIYITGPIGSDRKSSAQKLAAEKNLKYIDFDTEIEKRDGRSISRICMMMGEHEYRNKEYELLDELKDSDGHVCCCSDGILLDPMCAQLMEDAQILIADRDTDPETLWKQASEQTIPYAFMAEPDETKRKEKFMKIYEMRKNIYNKYKEITK